MKYGIGKAHGKIILIGEHAVVYNHSAIAIPFFATTITSKVYQAPSTKIASCLFTGEINDAPEELLPIVELIKNMQKTLNCGNIWIEIESNIPASAGMGSSAATASAIVEAIYQYVGISLDYKTRFDWVQFSEMLAHGNPSGIDALTTTHDNAWLFSKVKKPEAFSSYLPAYLVVGTSNQKGNTKDSIQIVKDKMKEDSMKNAIDRIGSLVEITLAAYTAQNVEEVGKCLSEAHGLLNLLGVSTITINQMVSIAIENGAVGAKLTGGGLGGCVIALTKTKQEAIKIRNNWLDQFDAQTWMLDLREGRYE